MTQINYNDRKFRSITTSNNGDVDGQTIFHYRQQEDILWATYSGGTVRWGTMTGLVKPNGDLVFNYQHVNVENQLRTGICTSVVSINDKGKIQLQESWTWTNGDLSSGQSLVEEL